MSNLTGDLSSVHNATPARETTTRTAPGWRTWMTLGLLASSGIGFSGAFAGIVPPSHAPRPTDIAGGQDTMDHFMRSMNVNASGLPAAPIQTVTESLAGRVRRDAAMLTMATPDEIDATPDYDFDDLDADVIR
ncbi:hypothetical protein [Pandoraea terrae]|nr:hypothetical protein [Pandoraea terrae]